MFLTQATNKTELPLTDMEKTGGRMSLLVGEGWSGVQLRARWIPEASSNPGGSVEQVVESMTSEDRRQLPFEGSH